MSTGYNPEFDPTGIEGGVDTNKLPWIRLPQAPGMSIKPLRASGESGAFSVLVQIKAGTVLNGLVYLGAMDMIILSGAMSYAGSALSGLLSPGTWGYVPANSRIGSLTADVDTEFLGNFYGPVAFVGADGRQVTGVQTALDVQAAARDRGIALVPSTLADCMGPLPRGYQGPAEPLAIAGKDSKALVDEAVGRRSVAAHPVNPHFIDTRAVSWIENPAVKDMAFKILRVSEETGITSLIVRHNGVAGPHYHLGAADFMVLHGRIGYRAGPPEGYGPGAWFYEPAGARHDATQRVSDEDLIYTANVYGPLQFDSGRGTPIVAVQSWMQYKELADGVGARLVRNTFEDDASLLAWAPLGSAGARL